MNRTEALLELVALESAYARTQKQTGDADVSNDDRQTNLGRVITAKAHKLGLATATVLTAKLEYRYNSVEGRSFVPSPEQALHIEAALWADNRFHDKYAQASLLARKACVTITTDSDGAYQTCSVEIEQAGLGWMKV